MWAKIYPRLKPLVAVLATVGRTLQRRDDRGPGRPRGARIHGLGETGSPAVPAAIATGLSF
ncbi:hypothetical protein [Frankia sp. QA3]|uniref:hypothetical protein n=1 Tax=Frankia sp. QA3 TaxID=710111 RepID=UPI000269CD0F|nr:hypothetical protein [Frankia sp. QA3]EIV95634.1 hypothetical protein FraQA3DRAFT_5474 [Frankia sp. QA3]